MNSSVLAGPRSLRTIRACWRCRLSCLSRRRYATDAADAGSRAGPTAPPSSLASFSLQLPPPPPPLAGIAHLTSRRLLSVAGPDAAKFLQGVTTSNMHPGAAANAAADAGAAAVDPRHGFYSGFLNAQGRVLHDVFVYRDTLTGATDAAAADPDTAFLVEVDADEAATLERHLRRYKLRARLRVRLLADDELRVWHAWGPGAAVASGAEAALGPAIALCDPRAPGLGWRYVAAATPGGLAVDTATDATYRIHRYLAGVAEGQREMLRGTALPLESNMDVMGGIDFRKGCYVGQELTIRTRHRGVVRKRILPCIVYEEGDAVPDTLAYAATTSRAAAVPPETAIGRVGKKGRGVGKWLAGVGNLGLALCRLEAMTDLVLPDEAAAVAASAAAAAAAVAPRTPGPFELKWTVEGAAEGEQVVHVQAFVPAWLRQAVTASTS